MRELHRVPEELCRHIGLEVARGLAAIHDHGAVHRDIKPENVLITAEHVVKVMDFGVARLQDEALRLSRAGGFVGSIEYAAPEQLDRADNATDGRADLYALGIVLYELATGQHPYRRDDARTVIRGVLEAEPRRAGDVNPQISPFFEEVVHTLIAKDPAERFASARDLVEVLGEGDEGPWWASRAQGIRLRTKQPLRRIRIPRETVLCGRDTELAQLREAYEAARHGEGRVVLIEGEAGIGKTRLVDEFAARLRQEGAEFSFLFGSHAPGGAGMSAGAFSEAFGEHFGRSGSASYLRNVPLLAPAFDALLRREPAPTGALELTSESLTSCFVHVTHNVAAERTMILLIDDLHFASEESRSLFLQLAAAAAGHRVLMIGTMRPGVPDAWVANCTRMDQTTQIRLGRLGAKDLTELLVDAFQSQRLAEELGFRIAHKSDGNPFFVFEIIRGLREGQLISRRPDGTWFRTNVIDEIQVPSTVTDLVQARLQDLSEEERELLDVASCVGFSFDPELVGRVAGMAMIPALRSFGRIESRHRLVRSAGADLVFDHHQVQETLYAALLERLRTRYHAAIAEALEAKHPDDERRAGALSVELCGHFLKGARGARALRYLPVALKHLEANFLNEQAVELADRALAVPRLLTGAARRDVLLEKNARLDLMGRREAQEEVLQEARALVDESDPASVLTVERAAAQLALATARYPSAQERFERCLALARELGDPRREAEATGNLGTVRFFLGQFEEARADAERHLEMASRVGDVQGQIQAERFVIASLTRLGRNEEAQARIPAMLERAEQSGDPHLEAQALGAASFAIVSRGRYEEARAYVERGLEVARSIGFRRGEAVATGNLGMVLWGLGYLDEAREQIEQWRRLTQEIGDRGGEAAAIGNLAQVLIALGRYQEAEANVEHKLAIAREIGDRVTEGRANGSMGEIEHARGRFAEAQTAMRVQLAIAREIGEGKQEANALTQLADVALDRGDLGEAQRLHQEALVIRRGMADAYTTAPLIGLARVALARGDAETALPMIEESLALAREHDRPATILVATMLRIVASGCPVSDLVEAIDAYEGRSDLRARLEARYRIWQLTGERAHLEEAHRLLQLALDRTAPEHRRTMIENVPLHAEIDAAWKEHGA